MTDYYEVLGVERDATQAQIKKAYQKLARQYHPDLAGRSEENEAKIKEINVAYETLSNPEKRREYDNPTPQGFGGFGDIFETFFQAAGGGRRGPIPRGQRGRDSLTHVRLTLAEAAFGVEKEISLDTYVRCGQCSGSCCAAGTSPVTCSVCQGSGSVQRIARTIMGQMMTTAACSECQGYGTVIASPCSECAGQGRVPSRTTLKVAIPAGMSEGTRIRLPGRGEAGPGGGPAGDLYVEIVEIPHPSLERAGEHLHAFVSIPLTAAALGTVFPLETLDGEQDVEIPAGTQTGAEIRLRGLGVTRLHRHSRGDLFVHVEVETPTDLDDAQRDLLEQLAALRGEESVRPSAQRPKEGFFSRLRDAFS
ncbi:MAG: molecular chaperone DnaJ [Buchananella hordeovulneris]|nr:molecular chaperone DnaJ [Buchananella hordeovulneris]